MQIQHVRLYPIATARTTGVTNQHVIVRINAGDSHVGWGEMSDLSHVPMYQFDIAELERTLNELLRGKDARNIAQIEDDLIRFYPDEGHMYSRSGLVRQGIDLALHDLLGRADGVPVWKILGGKLRDKLKVCYPIFRMRSLDEVGPNLERVQTAFEAGFDLIRVYVGAHAQADEAFLEQFAERFAGRVAIKSLDFSNLLDWRRAWQATEHMAALVNIMLVESPAPRNDFEGLAEFRRRSRWPTSEHVQHLHHGWQLLRNGSVDILNLSPYVLGGLRASLRLVALAEASRTSVLIGTTQELSLGTAAVAQLGAAARVLDYPCDNTGPRLYVDDVVVTPVRYEAGYLHVPEGPGLGVEVDEQRLEALAGAAKWTFGADLAGVLDRTPSTRPSATTSLRRPS
jgi:muconate cycloisomerase